jgi:hypothetical protein
MADLRMLVDPPLRLRLRVRLMVRLRRWHGRIVVLRLPR